MNIYIAHARKLDYQNLLYVPLKSSSLFQKHHFILPHDDIRHQNNTREFYQTLDLMIAEVSLPATGLGIELGWAKDDGTPIYCFYQEGTKPSGSIYAVTDHIQSYTDADDLLQRIAIIIQKYD